MPNLRHMERLGLATLIGLCFVACNSPQKVEGYPDEFVGVGLELKIRGDAPVVIKPLKGGPADVAGIRKGDRILSVNGVSTLKQTLGNVVMKLRGPPDSQVTIELMRGEQHIMVVLRRRSLRKVDGLYRAQK